MSDPECDRRRPRETVLEEREAKRVRFNVLDEEIDEWVETEEEWMRTDRCPWPNSSLSPRSSEWTQTKRNLEEERVRSLHH